MPEPVPEPVPDPLLAPRPELDPLRQPVPLPVPVPVPEAAPSPPALRPSVPPRRRGRTARGCLLLFLATLTFLWLERRQILPFLISHLARWEALPPSDPARAADNERALDLLAQYDIQVQAIGRAHLEQSGAAAVPQVINRLGVERGMRRLGLPGSLNLAGDPTPRLRALLLALTFQDFGDDARAWGRWWNEWKDLDRDDWALAALESGRQDEGLRALDWFARRHERDARVLRACMAILRRGDGVLRGEAYEHLVGCANQDFGYDPSRPAEEQPDALSAIDRWIARANGPREDLIPAER